MAQKDVDDFINIVIYAAEMVGSIAKNAKKLLSIFRRRSRKIKKQSLQETE
jgi:hypothetical protein